MNMEGFLYKKRHMRSRMGTKLKQFNNQVTNYSEQVWPLRYVALKDGLFTYYEWDENLEPVPENNSAARKSKLIRSLDLRKGDVKLKICLPSQQWFGKDILGKLPAQLVGSTAPTQFHFEITSGIFNTQSFETWSFCARNGRDCSLWISAISEVIFLNRKTGSKKGYDDTNNSRGPTPFGTGKETKLYAIVQSFLKTNPTPMSLLDKNGLFVELAALLCIMNALIMYYFSGKEASNDGTFQQLFAVSVLSLLLFGRVAALNRQAELDGWKKATSLLSQKIAQSLPEEPAQKLFSKIQVAHNLTFSESFEKETDDVINKYGCVQNKSLKLRGDNYKSTGKKIPSKSSLFQPVGTDMYQSNSSKEYHVMERIQIPEKFLTLSTDLGTEWPKSLPKLLVVNLQIPKASKNGMMSNLMSSAAPSYFLISYHTPSSELIKMAQMVENNEIIDDNATILLLKWLETCELDAKMKHRLKILAYIYNFKDAGLPSICSRFNGKPAMIKEALRIYRGKDNQYLELDIDMRPNNYLATSAINSIIPGLLLKLSFALTLIVQGETHEELPERSINAIEYMNIDARNVEFWPFENE